MYISRCEYNMILYDLLINFYLKTCGAVIKKVLKIDST